MASIEYFYAAHSSYAYLGSARFMEIAAAAGRSIVHKPIALGTVVEAVGSAPFSARSDAYREYFFVREIQRWSEYRAAPVCGRPRHHDNDITLANCMLVAGIEDGQVVDTLAHALLQAHWRDDADLADHATLQRVGTQAGFDAQALLTAAGSSKVRSVYEANTREAIERSVFGSPTYVVDGDPFYGQDRLELVERALRDPFVAGWQSANT